MESFRMFLQDSLGSLETVDTLTEIDVDDLVPNPKNIYGIREIEELSTMIAWTKEITPLTVKPVDDGKYMIIKGHRRWTAVKQALSKGFLKKRTLPCRIKVYNDHEIIKENGDKMTISADDIEMLNLVLDNRGQRSKLTIGESEKEQQMLFDFAKNFYNAMPQQEKEKWHGFHKFFATEILCISNTRYRRNQMLYKLMPEVQDAVDNGDLTEGYAIELATLFDKTDKVSGAENGQKQLERLDQILNGEVSSAIKDIQAEKRRLKDLHRQNAEYDKLGEEIFGGKKTEIVDEEAEDIFSDEDVESCDDDKDSTAENDDGGEETSSAEDEAVDRPYRAETTAGEVSRQSAAAPLNVGNPTDEATIWFVNVCKGIIDDAKRKKEEAERKGDELASKLWTMRISVADYNVALMQANMNNR